MNKVKVLLILVAGAVIGLFFYENWGLAIPIKLFGKELCSLPGSLIIMICFVLGFLMGWLGHVSWRRQRRRKAEAATNVAAVSGEKQGQAQSQ